MPGLRLFPAPMLLLLLLAALLASGGAGAQHATPSPESAACAEARLALDAALQSHVAGQAASTRRLEAARRRTQSTCLGGDAAPVPGPRTTPQAPYMVPAPPSPAARMPAPSATLPTPAPAVPALPAPSPRVLGPCDATGCWDNQGRRLNEGGGIYSAPGGGVCSVQGIFATCP